MKKIYITLIIVLEFINLINLYGQMYQFDTIPNNYINQILSLNHDENDVLFVGCENIGMIFSRDQGQSFMRIIDNGINSIYKYVLDDTSTIFFLDNAGRIYKTPRKFFDIQLITKGIENVHISSLNLTKSKLLFAGAWNGDLYKSTDFGDSWEVVIIGNNDESIDDIFFYRNDIYIAKNRKGILKSTDNGVTWFNLNNGITGKFPLKLINDEDGNFYLADYGDGVYKTTDEGVSWQTINVGITSLLITDISRNKNNDIFIVTEGAGIFKSTDRGNSWAKVFKGEQSQEFICIDIDNNGIIFAADYNSRGFRSKDNGNTWENFTKKKEPDKPKNEILSIAIDSNNVFYCLSYENLSISDDDGLSWTSIAFPLTSDELRYESYIPKIKIINNDILYFSDLNKCYSTTNRGKTWINHSGSMDQDEYITSISENSTGNIFYIISYL